MSQMECFLSNFPYLKYVKLALKGDNDLGDGNRWQILSSSLTTFSFKFHVELTSVDETLQSFRTLFWLEEKRWFVDYRNKCLYSVCHSHANISNDSLQASHSKEKQNSVYTLDERQRWYVYYDQQLLKDIPLKSKLPYIRECKMIMIPTAVLKKIEGYQLKQIQKLDVRIVFEDKTHKDTIKILLHLFPCIKHLILRHVIDLSIEDMIFIIDKFEYLQNVSFYDKCSPFTETIIYDQQNLISQITWRLIDKNFTCRILRSYQRNESEGIHWWIGAEVCVSHTIIYY
jgi:hypothetical protein